MHTAVPQTESKEQWVTIMGSIMQDKTSQNDVDDRDVLSDRLAELLNRNRSFRWRNDNYSEGGACDLHWTTPLLSRANWMLLQSRFKGFNLNEAKKLIVWRGGKSWRSSLRVFAFTATFSTLVAIFLTAQLLIAAFCGLIWIAWQSLSLLINWKDLCSSWCPIWIQTRVPSALVASVEWIDAVLLAGRQFAGREWTEDGFIWESPTSSLFSFRKEKSPPISSWSKILLDLPPPALKELGRRLSLDPRYVWTWMNRSWQENDLAASKPFLRTSWSTAEHVVAVHFCYTMLREDQLNNRVCRENSKTDKSDQQQSAFQIAQEVRTGSSEEDQASSKDSSAALAGNLPPSIVYYDSRHQSDPFIVESCESPNQAGTFKVEVTLHDDNGQRTERLQDQFVSDFTPELDEMSPTSQVSARSEIFDVEADLPWIDVGAKIGMRFLNSAHMKSKASSEDNAELLKGNDSIKRVAEDEGATPGRKQLHKPIHPMWTSTMSVPYGSPATDQTNDSPQKNFSLMLHTPPRTKGIDSIAAFPHEEINLIENQAEGRDVNEPSLVDPTIMRDSTESLSGFSVDYVMQNEDVGVALVASENGDVEASQVQDRSTVHARRQPLAVGVKVAVPVTPYQPGTRSRMLSSKCQMGTVVSSRRIFVSDGGAPCSISGTNALSVTCKLDRCFLRNGEFSELTFRVKDGWKDRYMPRHSKVPIGSCVSTSFGLGVLVGWRVEDDCHVVRCLWQRRGDGSAHAYMNRNAIHGTIEAAVGFEVGTANGDGIVIACVQGGRTFESPRFMVALSEEGRHKGQVVEVNRKDIMHCHGAQFIPVIEHIREAALFQLQVDIYRAALREQRLDGSSLVYKDEDEEDPVWDSWHGCLDTLWKSFLRAVDENKEFDEGLNEFVSEIIDFLEGLEGKEGGKENENVDVVQKNDVSSKDSDESTVERPSDRQDSGFWFINEVLGGVFQQQEEQEIELVYSNRKVDGDLDKDTVPDDIRKRYYDRAFVILKVLMKTVSIARAESVEFPVSLIQQSA